MSEFWKQAPAIIEAAAKSNLGILALLVLATAVVGFVFFRGASHTIRLAIFFTFVLGAAVFAVAAVRVPTSTPTPDREPQSSDHLRVVVRSVTLGLKDSGSELGAWMTVGNIGPGTLLINTVAVVVNATSQGDGSVLARRIELAKNLSLPPDSIEPVELETTGITWTRRMTPVTDTPTPRTHFFRILIQVQATVARTGQDVWLDIDAPKPTFMTCGFPCVAVYSLNVSAGKSGRKDCTAIPAGGRLEGGMPVA